MFTPDDLRYHQQRHYTEMLATDITPEHRSFLRQQLHNFRQPASTGCLVHGERIGNAQVLIAQPINTFL